MEILLPIVTFCERIAVIITYNYEPPASVEVGRHRRAVQNNALADEYSEL